MTAATGGVGSSARVDVALRDGSTVRLRRARPGDFDEVRTFLEALLLESHWLRFFGAGTDSSMRRPSRCGAVAVRSPQSVSLVAVTGADSHVIGHGMYVRGRPGEAEVAFAVADDWLEARPTTRCVESPERLYPQALGHVGFEAAAASA